MHQFRLLIVVLVFHTEHFFKQFFIHYDFIAVADKYSVESISRIKREP
jgi:hypothetical protein